MESLLEIVEKPHVAHHASSPSETHENVYIALRPILATRNASEQRRISNAVPLEYRASDRPDLIYCHPSIIGPRRNERPESHRSIPCALDIRYFCHNRNI